MLSPHFVELGLTYLLAAMMPGPSVALIIRNGILHSRQSSIQACLGTIAGTAIQSGSILIGLIFIENNSIIFQAIKVACSFYLIYLGVKILASKMIKKDNHLTLKFHSINSYSKRHLGYFIEGFLVEFLNPLAFTFFISIMTVIIPTEEPWTIKFGYWLEIIILAFIWFFSVSIIFSYEKITIHTKKFNKTLETLAGSVFIIFGSKMFIY